MGCLPIVAVLTPRLLLFFIFILTDWFQKAYETVIWPVLGFVFLPYTTLAYMAAILNNDRELNGWWLFLYMMAFLGDVSRFYSIDFQSNVDPSK